jgi:hypothetical protein
MPRYLTLARFHQDSLRFNCRTQLDLEAAKRKQNRERKKKENGKKKEENKKERKKKDKSEKKKEKEMKRKKEVGHLF